jgi:hypothetical protein
MALVRLWLSGRLLLLVVVIMLLRGRRGRGEAADYRECGFQMSDGSDLCIRSRRQSHQMHGYIVINTKPECMCFDNFDNGDGYLEQEQCRPKCFYIHCPTSGILWYISSYMRPTQPPASPPLPITPKPPAIHSAATAAATPLIMYHLRFLAICLS